MSDTVITGQPEKNVITEVETATVVPRTRSNAVLGDTFLFKKKSFLKIVEIPFFIPTGLKKILSTQNNAFSLA